MNRLLAILVVLLAATPAAATKFRRPLSGADCANTPRGRCYVTAYYDLNRSNGSLRDWTCGNDTYDNHSGTDIGVGSWDGMAVGVDVLAGADGTVEDAHDGEYDRCSSADCGTANYVILRHADGKRSLYWHLKKWSVAVSVGDRVTCGTKLGDVGSSGRSTGPHLHFQVNVSGSPDDPFAANSGCGGQTSFWVDQGSYGGLPGTCCEGGCTEPDRNGQEYVSQSPDDDLHYQPGQTFQMRFRVRNTGNTTWTRAAGFKLVHVGDTPASPAFTSPATVELGESESIAPNAEKVWEFDVTVPGSAGGPYRSTFNMAKGSSEFGGSFYIGVIVDPPIDPDADGDGVTVGGGDCDDSDAATKPGATDPCDGVDRDCDGDVDGDAPPQDCESACGPGVQQCEGGAYGTCDAPAPGVEICDGQDDDCNGKIDDGVGLCPDGQSCTQGRCQRPGEVVSAGGGDIMVVAPPDEAPAAGEPPGSNEAIEGQLDCSAAGGGASLAWIALGLAALVLRRRR